MLMRVEHGICGIWSFVCFLHKNKFKLTGSARGFMSSLTSMLNVWAVTSRLHVLALKGRSRLPCGSTTVHIVTAAFTCLEKELSRKMLQSMREFRLTRKKVNRKLDWGSYHCNNSLMQKYLDIWQAETFCLSFLFNKARRVDLCSLHMHFLNTFHTTVAE